MKLHKIGLTTLLTLLTTLSVGDGQFILNSQLKMSMAATLAQTPSSPKVEAARLIQQGWQQLKNQQYQAALQSFQQALALYQKISDRHSEATAQMLVGVAYSYLGDFPRTIESLQQSVALARETNQHKLETAAQQLLSIVQTYNTPQRAEADKLLRQGWQQFQNEQYQAALQSSQQALALYKEIGLREREGRALLVIGATYLGSGDFPRAVESLQQSLALARETDSQKLETVAQKLLSIAQTYNTPQRAEADKLLQQGLQQIQNQQYQAALQSCQQALALYKEIGLRGREGRALLGIGAAYLGLRNFSRAIEPLNQSLALAREIKDQKLETAAQQVLSIAQSQSKRRKANNKGLLAAKEILELKLNNDLWVFSVGNRAGEIIKATSKPINLPAFTWVGKAK